MISNPPSAVSAGMCVLCIDDNPDIADTEAMLLGLVGFDARPCYGGRDALAVVETVWPSICLIDLAMPGMTGHQLAAKLRQMAQERPLLLIAVTAMMTDVCGDWALSFDLHLFKPVQSERLLAAVSYTDRPHFQRAGLISALKNPDDLPLLPTI